MQVGWLKSATFGYRLFVESRRFGPTPPAFGAREDLWRQKNRVSGLSCGVVCVILCLAV